MPRTSRLGRSVRASLCAASAAFLLFAAAPASVSGASTSAAAPRSSSGCTSKVAHACDEVHVVYSGTMQSNTSGSGRTKDVMLNWSISYDGTLEGLGTGKVLPKVDSLSGNETLSYSTGVGCTTGLTLNPSFNTQQMIGVTSPGAVYSGPLQNYGFQDRLNRKTYVVEGSLGSYSFRGDGGSRSLATPSNPDSATGCDLFAADGPSNNPEAAAFQRALRPYALFAADGTPDPSTPQTISVVWNQTVGGDHNQGQLNEKLSFSAKAAGGKTPTKRRSSSSTTKPTTAKG